MNSTDQKQAGSKQSPRSLPRFVLNIPILVLIIIVSLPVSSAKAEPSSQSSIPDSLGWDSGPHPIADLKHVVKTFASDAWHIASFPAHMSAKEAGVLAGVLAVTGLVYSYDQEILDAANRNEESKLLKPLWELGDFVEPIGHMGNTNAWYMGGAALGYVTRQEKLTLICTQILESHFIAGLGKNAIQYYLGRPRPFQGMGSRKFGVDDATSFPSGHSSNIFQLAPILSHHVDYPAFTVFAYTAAASVGIQRVRSDMHWPSDVVLSAFYGWSVAKGVLRLHEGRKMAVKPYASQFGMGLQLVAGF